MLCVNFFKAPCLVKRLRHLRDSYLGFSARYICNPVPCSNDQIDPGNSSVGKHGSSPDPFLCGIVSTAGSSIISPTSADGSPETVPVSERSQQLAERRRGSSPASEARL